VSVEEVCLTSLERDRIPTPRPIAAREIPLINRVEEMNALKEAVFRAVHGEGGLVFIIGEAGIGKTRLIREVGAYARSRGVQILYGRCPALFRMDGVPPYVLWKEVIKDYLRECTPEQLNRVIGFYPAEVAKLVPEISQKLRAFPQSFPISPEQEQNRLFEAVTQFIVNISQETPLLVVLDDLQWTDPSSLLLMHYLARGVQKTPLLLLGAYRNTDIDSKHPLTPVLTELKRERLPQTVSLRRMSLDDISEMIRQILEQDDVPAEFCKMIYEKTRGNPFFTEEVINSLKEEETIYQEENRWKIKEVTEIELPGTVKSLIKARVGRLDDEHQHVLTMASLVGNDFTFEALQAVTGLEEDKLRKIVDDLLKAGLFKHRVTRGEDVCSFADIIVRDVVYDEVGTFERKKLHKVVGTALQKVYGQKAEEHLGELALHFFEGGEKDKALDYFLKAGEKAQKIYANNEAASYYQSALMLLEDRGDKLLEKGQVLERLGDLNSILAEYKNSLRFLNEGLLLWKQLDEKRKAADIHRKIASILWSVDGNLEKAIEHYTEASEILTAEPESVELARLHLSLAGMHFQTGDFAKTLTSAEEALELSKRIAQFDTMARSYSLLGAVFINRGEIKKSCEYLEKALKISLDNNYPEYALNAYNNLAVSLPAEENKRRQECAEKAYELAKKAGIVGSISWQGSGLASLYAFMGDTKKALLLAEESVALDKKAGNLFSLSFTNAVLGVIYEIMGEWDSGEHCLRQALADSEKLHAYQAAWMCYGSLGVLYYDKGEHAKAREFFEKMCNILEKVGAKMPPWHHMYYASYYALAVMELRDLEKAKSIINLMYESARPMDDKALIASANALRAMQFRAEKKWEQSIELFEKSFQEFEALGIRYWMTYYFAGVTTQYARTCLERDQKGDKERARDLLNQALEIFTKMDAKKDVEKVEATIAFIETGKVVSKPKALEHVSTGHTELDQLLHGGIPLNYAIVLTSPSCDERDLLVGSFLETGAKNSKVAFYVTTNPGSAKALAEEYQPNLQLFVCNPQADAIVKDAPNIVKLKGVENLTDISIALTSAIHKLDPSLSGPRRICLGLVSDVLLQHHAVQTRRWLTGLIPELQSEGFTTLAVMDSRIHPPEELYAIVGLFDGEINIRERETEKGTVKYLKIQKMSNQEYLEEELLLRKEGHP
jgi:adenylate cyclase